MSRLDELLDASWDGIPFFVRNELMTEGGRRIILHDYPNTNTRYVEDQGELPQKFKVTAFVSGWDFIDRSDRLEEALRTKGKGELILPTFGMMSLYAMPYKKDASQKAVGEIRFELEFVAGRAITGPSRIEPTLETVYVDAEEVMEATADVMEDKWQPPTTLDNIKSAIFDLGQMSNAVSIVTATVNNSYDIETAIRLININAPKLILSGNSMKTSFMGDLWKKVSIGMSTEGFKTVLDLTKMGGDLTLALSDVRTAYRTADDIGDWTVLLWPATTLERIVRNANRLVNVNAGRIAALAVAHEVAAASDYGTAEEVQEAWEDLEAERRRLFVYDTVDPTLIQSDPVVRTAQAKLSESTEIVLTKKKESLPFLKEIDNKSPVSVYVQTYMLYGGDITTPEELDKTVQNIRSLNPTLPADKLLGLTTVLQNDF